MDSVKQRTHLDLSIFCCPVCRGDLNFSTEGSKKLGVPRNDLTLLGESTLSCPKCKKEFPIENNIPRLFASNEWSADKEDITEKMKAFYEETPFPNYDDFDSVASLIDKAEGGMFAKLLGKQVPLHTKILEAGCGTGQLSAFLSVANREVYGADLCLNSLSLGEGFRRKNSLDRLHFLQMNLFQPAFKDESFDLVISNGVLHHTSDPRLAFESIARLVKPGGYILIGLYHKYGRLITDTRRLIFSVAGSSLDFLDPQLRKVRSSGGKWKAWFMDQYNNPHESKHTIAGVLPWFEEEGFDVIKTIPKTKLFSNWSENERLFVRDEIAGPGELLLTELGMITSGSREGGFFIMIGKKR